MPSGESTIPVGTEFTVYWCPRCEIQTWGPWHTCERPSPLIPQLDVETQCLIAKFRQSDLDKGDSDA